MSITHIIKNLSENNWNNQKNDYSQLQSKNPRINLVTNPAELRANDIVDWGNCGKEFDFLPTPLSVKSTNGLSLKLSSLGTFLRLTEGSGIKGNFTSGDELLFLEFADSAITIDFATPIFGIGTQIQRAFFGAFTGIIEAFDRSGKSLGKFSVSGKSNSSTPFIGVVSETANISRITLYVPENGGYGFTINGLSIVTQLEQPTLPSNLFLFNKNRSVSTTFNIFQYNN
ncbi:hypothetical protein ACE1B6_05675 [Aerosakkonemataceae cyanobacterium BLCC-F154]|uniref:Uncharacterized protein n=1 Tax=Floridaenema fluviatile BLCC-F154 TaxID=3153640 RepID=A0ABV4Y7H5_9CYAN